MYKFSWLIPLIFIAGCHTDAVLPDANSSTLSATSQPGWKTESLNEDYTIQFPKSYIGGIRQTIEGPQFMKYREDQKASFNGQLPPLSYGLSLAQPRPDTIMFSTIPLTKTVTFERNGQIQSVFYYTQQAKTFGQVYVLKNTQLRACLTVSYTYDIQSEVLGILQTIQPK